MVCTVVHKELRIVIKSMLPSEIVNPNIKLLYLGGLEPQAKPHKHQVQSIDCYHRVLSRKTSLQEQFDGE